MEIIYICEAPQGEGPVQLAHNPIKSTKPRISSINTMIFFFHKSRANPRTPEIWYWLLPLQCQKWKQLTVSKTFLLHPSLKKKKKIRNIKWLLICEMFCYLVTFKKCNLTPPSISWTDSPETFLAQIHLQKDFLPP